MVRLSSSIVTFLLVGSTSAFAPTSISSQTRNNVILQMGEEETGAEPVKVGVIGCGRIGIVHLGAINKAPGVLPIVVSNPTVSKAEKGERLTCI